MEPQKASTSQSNPKKEEQSWRHHTSWFQTYYKAIVMKTVWYWQKEIHNKAMEQNREPRNEHFNWYLTKKSGILNGEMIVCSINVAGKTGLPPAKNKLDSYLTPLTKIISKWIKDLNIRFETVKLLEENRGKKLLHIGLGSNFWIWHKKYKQ